jgi:5'-nucleotidase
MQNTSPTLVIGISSRALFNLSKENELFEQEGAEVYKQYQITNEEVLLEPGTGFQLVESLLKLNNYVKNQRLVDVVIMSRNSSEISLRLFNSVSHYNLDIARAVFTTGAPLAPYLQAFNVDLFLSAHLEDVQGAIDAGFASAMIFPFNSKPQSPLHQIRIAFDGDAVLFSEESENIFQNEGIDSFIEHERKNAKNPLPKGPFAPFLHQLAKVQSLLPPDTELIRTALITARDSNVHERVIRTLRSWNIIVNETFFMGGLSKSKVLEAFGAHIFFDDQIAHLEPASKIVPTALVPHPSKRL